MRSSLRHLRYQRENTHVSIHHEKTITHHDANTLLTCYVSRQATSKEKDKENSCNTSKERDGS